jgi:formyltetrahydrofolate deformylase
MPTLSYVNKKPLHFPPRPRYNRAMYVLTLHCIDKPGVVAAVATVLSNTQCNIEESSQFNDHLSGHFFMRVVLSPLTDHAVENFQTQFEDIAATYDMVWALAQYDAPVKTLLMVSKVDHCLNDILYRWRTKQLNIEITGVVSNHEDTRTLVEDRGIPFHYLPINNDKAEQEAKLRAIITETDSDLIVMARYMQILSQEFCNDHHGRVINIHHSFLPGFKGAKPYHQAHQRGVKIIGATAHFATGDLDEGPIIEQDTVRIDHSHTPKKLQILGRDSESKVLSRAIQMYSEHRIFLHDARTVIL